MSVAVRVRLAAAALAASVALACGGTYHPPVVEGAAGTGSTVAAGEALGADGETAPGVTATGGGPVGGPRPTTAGGRASPSGAPGQAPTPSGANRGGGERPAVVKVGGIYPMSGPLAGLGVGWMAGVSAVFEDVNAQGGIDGTRIQLIAEDDQFDPAQTRRKVQKLLEEEGVTAFMGILTPPGLQQSLAEIEAAGAIVMPTTGAADNFGSRHLFPTFQHCNVQLAGNAAHAVQERGARKLGYLVLDLEVARTCAEYSMEVARSLGAEIVYEGSVGVSAPDCVPHILSARQAGAELLVVMTDNLGVIRCRQAARQQAWAVPFTVPANLHEDDAVIAALGDDAEGMFLASPYSGAESPEFERLCGAVRRYHPDVDVNFFTISGCIGARLYVDALRAAGPGASGQEIIAFLESKTHSTGGLSPDLTYTPDDHQPYEATRISEVRQGKWVPITGFFVPPRP